MQRDSTGPQQSDGAGCSFSFEALALPSDNLRLDEQRPAVFFSSVRFQPGSFLSPEENPAAMH